MSLEANTSIIIYGLGISSALLVIIFLYYLRRQNPENFNERTKTKQLRELESELQKEKREKSELQKKNEKLAQILSKEIKDTIGDINFVQKAIDQKLAQEKIGGTFHLFGKKTENTKDLYEISVEQSISEIKDNIPTVIPAYEPTENSTKLNDGSVLRENTPEASKGRTFYQKQNIVIREFDRSDFHFSSAALIGGYFGEHGNTVCNPFLNTKPKLFDKQELFLRIQTFLNNMVKDELYVISDDDLKELKKNIWSGSIKKIIDAIDKTNEKNEFTKESDGVDLSGRSIFKYLLVRTLDNMGYRAYTSKDEDEKKQRDSVAMGVMKKKMMKNKGIQIELTPEEIKIEEQFKMNAEVINEIASVIRSKSVIQLYRDVQESEKIKEISRRSTAIRVANSYLNSIGWEFLDIDIMDHVLKIKIPVEDIFSRKLSRLLEHYRHEKDLSLVEIYLY